MELPKEPKLTYERILNDVSASVRTDFITTACLHAKFVIVGYNSGRLNIFDHQGNKINTRNLCLHVKPINCISVDKKGNYFVSCSDESLVVYGLCDDTYNHVIMLDKPVKLVAIDPEERRRYVTDGDGLILHKIKVSYIDKLKGDKPLVLWEEKPIRALSWCGKFIACATDTVIKVFYDPPRPYCAITRIKRSSENTGDDPAQLAWKDDRTLLVGWGPNIKFYSIRDRPPDQITDGVPECYAVRVITFNTDYVIHGLAPLKENLLTLHQQPLDNQLQIQVLEVLADDNYDELYGELVKPRITPDSSNSSSSRTALQPSASLKNSRLLSLHEEGIYLIVCPRDIISAKPRDSDDHFEWLIEHEQYEECYEFATKNSDKLVRHSLREIEELYMEDLLNANDPDSYSRAAQICASICEMNQTKWDEAIEKFIGLNQLSQLLPYLPKCLSVESYDLILEEFLRNDSISFFKAIKELPSNLYSLKKITDNVIDRLNNDPKNLVLNEALAELYSKSGKFEEAVQIYLDYNDRTRIFDLIRSNELISSLEKNTEKLMQLDSDQTAQLLVENVDVIPMKSVIDKLRKYKSQKYLMAYLHRLLLKDQDCCIEYHDLLIKLYAEHQPENLMGFLKLSTAYNLEEALDICKSKNLVKEVIFLYSRMGDLREALKYIVEEKGDVNEAIEFCKEHQDQDLWLDLINHVVEKRRDCIGQLLKNIVTHLDDPAQLIERIPPGCEIDEFIPSLRQALLDYDVQIELEKSLRGLQAEDAFKLLQKQLELQSRGILITDSRMCDHCNQILIPDHLKDESLTRVPDVTGHQSSSNDAVVFGCHHVFHEDCCTNPETGVPTCRACMLEKDEEK
uniref:Vacuolar protein sorting-associated protein 41 n=1 Tax=Aceria tosichella TaxID=561515 RepID=A0A6G1SCB3_9ACAR